MYMLNANSKTYAMIICYKFSDYHAVNIGDFSFFPMCSRMCNKHILFCVQTNGICPTVVHKLCDYIEINITLSLFWFGPTRIPIAIWVDPISNWVRLRFGSEHKHAIFHKHVIFCCKRYWHFKYTKESIVFKNPIKSITLLENSAFTQPL